MKNNSVKVAVAMSAIALASAAPVGATGITPEYMSMFTTQHSISAKDASEAVAPESIEFTVSGLSWVEAAAKPISSIDKDAIAASLKGYGFTTSKSNQAALEHLINFNKPMAGEEPAAATYGGDKSAFFKFGNAPLDTDEMAHVEAQFAESDSDSIFNLDATLFRASALASYTAAGYSSVITDMVGKWATPSTSGSTLRDPRTFGQMVNM